MAIISSIRKHIWFVMILLGLALAAFIMMDMTGSKTSGMTAQYTLAEVDGQRIDHRDFQQAQNVLGNGQDAYGTRDYLWDFFVEKAIVANESDELGLAVTKDELLELEFGTNLSPVIERNLADPNTRQVNRELLNQYKDAIESGQLEGKFRSFWKFQESQIIKERLQTKLNNLVAKGMYMPSWRVQKIYDAQNSKIDLQYVKIPFDEVEDNAVTITDEDLNGYLKSHSAEFDNTEETRSIVFATKEVFPTKDDSLKLIAGLTELKADFNTTADDSLFIENNYGIWNPAFVKASTLTSIGLKDSISSMAKGGTYGPYLEGAQYLVAKMMDSKLVPDSVQVRHILRKVTNQEEAAIATQLIDSIKTVLEAGGSFEDLAKAHSQDPGSAIKGGELGMTAPGRMVPAFNDVIFFQAETNKFYTTFTRFGIHLIEVTDKVFTTDELSYNIAYLKEDIVPSEATQASVYDEMAEIMTTNRTYDALNKYADENPAVVLETVHGIKRNDHSVGKLESSQGSRDIVRWAYEGGTEIGNVAPEVYAFQAPLRYNNKYVVTSLIGVYPKGLASLETVREDIIDLVKNDKKATQLMSQITGQDLGSISAKYDTKVDTAKDVSFFGGFIPGSGNEPSVVGKAFGLADGAFTLVKGNAGVYAVKRMSTTAATDANNIPQLRKINMSQYATKVANYLTPSLRKMVDIEDNRFNYY